MRFALLKDFRQTVNIRVVHFERNFRQSEIPAGAVDRQVAHRQQDYLSLAVVKGDGDDILHKELKL